MTPINHIHYKKHCAICSKMYSWCRCPSAGSYKKLHGVCESCKTLHKSETMDYQKKENPNEPLRFKELMMVIGNIFYYWIDEEEVANKFTADFLEGGHWLVYNWIPKNEIWIDINNDWNTIADCIWHESLENAKMQMGMNYMEAHMQALHIEDFCRQNAAGQTGTNENSVDNLLTDAAKYNNGKAK